MRDGTIVSRRGARFKPSVVRSYAPCLGLAVHADGR
jgi:hypothetical protein